MCLMWCCESRVKKCANDAEYYMDFCLDNTLTDGGIVFGIFYSSHPHQIKIVGVNIVDASIVCQDIVGTEKISIFLLLKKVMQFLKY